MRKQLFALLVLFVMSAALFGSSSVRAAPVNDGGDPANEVLIISKACGEKTTGETLPLPSFTNKTTGDLQFVLVSHYQYNGTELLFMRTWVSPVGGGLVATGPKGSMPARLWTGCLKAHVLKILSNEYPKIDVIQS